MEHFLLYSIGLSIVYFLSIVLAKHPADFPPYAKATDAPDQALSPNGRLLLSNDRPTLLPAAHVYEAVENAICHPYIGRISSEVRLENEAQLMSPASH